MKFKLILSLLFTIATIFTALHKAEHIKAEESSTCQVCIVHDHLASADILQDFKEIVSLSFDKVQLQNKLLHPHAKKNANHSTAPPRIS